MVNKDTPTSAVLNFLCVYVFMILERADRRNIKVTAFYVYVYVLCFMFLERTQSRD